MALVTVREAKCQYMYSSFVSSIVWIGDTRQWSWQGGRESTLPTHIYEMPIKGYQQPNGYYARYRSHPLK
jgi:hypothetical protein